jgi:CheY-like chemotaxis protein
VKAIKALAANPINVIVLDYRTPFDRKDFVSGRSSTLEALTDIDPFLPLVLTRESEVELDHATSLMADMVLTHPVEPSALLEAIDTLLVETLKERVHRKSADFTIIR